MENMFQKAFAGRRIALLKKTLRIAQSDERQTQHAAAFVVQNIPQHQVLQKISLSEERISRLKVD